jgi:hypothetical protein
MTKSIGAILATERSLSDALIKVELVISRALKSSEVRENVSGYSKMYTPQAGYNMPNLNQELEKIINSY